MAPYVAAGALGAFYELGWTALSTETHQDSLEAMRVRGQ